MLSDPGRYDYLPSIDRPKLTWPGGARIAVWVAPNIEHYEYAPLASPVRTATPRPPPDLPWLMPRDYGNRAGVWRMMEVMDRYGVRGSVSRRSARLLVEYTHAARLGYLYQDKISNPARGEHAGVDFINRTLSVTLSTFVGR